MDELETVNIIHLGADLIALNKCGREYTRSYVHRLVIACAPSLCTVRLYNLPERIPAIPGPATHRQNDSAVVRRLGGRVDRLRAVLPTAASARIPLCALVDPLSAAQETGYSARRAAVIEGRARYP